VRWSGTSRGIGRLQGTESELEKPGRLVEEYPSTHVSPARSIPTLATLLWVLGMLLPGAGVRGHEALFYRAINLNGPPLILDGRAWEGEATTNRVLGGKAFENQQVALRPATDPTRARMIRSSRLGNRFEVALTEVPTGSYQVVAYVWEDNHSEQFDLLLNDRVVEEKFHSGQAGSWHRLGPWPVRIEGTNTVIRIAAKGPGHGAANLSGIEVWSGTGPIPRPEAPRFVAEPTPEQVAFFESRIRPVLAEHCQECHGTQTGKSKGGLLLDSRAGIVRGGDSGPVITPGDPESSLLIQAVRRTDPNLAMPPRAPLPEQAIRDLVTWVRMGAPDPRTRDTVASRDSRASIDWNQARSWWAFRPVTDPPIPGVQGTGWPANGLDSFVLSRLEAAGLGPSDDAEPRALVRRAAFDLTGLPPDPAVVEDYARDPSAEAFARVVDSLLESPRYGERWGRHWLDVVRYADTAGDNSDFPVPQLHRYRDWVIRAFNRDQPFHEFVRDQIAGDLVPGGTPDERLGRIIATGYIAGARRFGSRVEDYPQHLTIEDTLDNLGRAFLGLSLNCARCHDHKFDPIPTADYYSLYGIFHSTRYPWPGIELDQRQRDLVPLVTPERLDDFRARWSVRQAETDRLRQRLQRARDALKSAQADGKSAAEAAVREAEKALADHAGQPPLAEMAYAVAESERPADARIQLKGDPARPGATVPRRFLQVLGGAALPEGTGGSGRRQLADWITGTENPLVDRVWVNRVWHHHFGRGLVPTPNDFGRQGRPPSHPELLDWLATRFRASGGSTKALHRLILGSRTYRQSSVRSPASIDRDPANELLGAFPRRRLDAEALRDSLLHLGQALDLAAAGAHPFPPEHEWRFTQHNPFRALYESRHRSVFLMTQRIQRHPFLATFDGADPSASTSARLTSTTPVQALFLLNDPMVHEQAARFARRVLLSGSTPTQRIDSAYRWALGRPPTSEEASLALGFLESARGRSPRPGPDDPAAWESLCRALFRLNEFVYLD
jgi:hypothetical protein